MNITYSPPFDPDRRITTPLASFVSDHMGGWASHDQLDTLHDRSRNTAQALGRLVEVLTKKGILDTEDIVHIVDHYHNSADAIEITP